MKKIAVVFGGQSHEHEVSLRSGLTFLQQIDYKKFNVVPVLISKDGSWTKYVELNSPVESLEQLVPDHQFTNSTTYNWKDAVDIFFPLIHGETGEDGKLQGFFEMIGVPYVGSNVEASAVGMNKVLSKMVAQQLGGVNIVPYLIVKKDSWLQDKVVNLTMDYPVFIKPARAGSSVGVSKVYNKEELETSLHKAFEIDSLVLIEKAIIGREIEVAVIGNDSPEASVVGEIEFVSDFYDYENKYMNDSSIMHIPARIASEEQGAVRKMALDVYTSIGCSGYARVDFFVEEKTDRVYFNEINTSPGMTNKSMFPVLFSDKYTFTDLLSKIIENSFC
ncbi:D-alanine--D-alanine ligase family protein [Priestia filamentosa]|uniref:D-alanine--D-alanine ligase family protein n=1 Tax=Priestia filamentosa TaxID=1402861 RepID=UPI00397E32D4